MTDGAAGRLETQLRDAKPNYTPGEAVAEATRCLYCHDAPCVTACPTGIDIPGFIRKIATDNVRGSAQRILSSNLLGYSCARVCPVEVLCVGACVYNDWHRTPIAIGGCSATPSRRRSPTVARRCSRRRRPPGKKVACIGAGPASLAAAGYLALEGVAVTLFEKRKLAGGLNVTGIAPYKMHAADAALEIEFVRGLGVTIRDGVEVGKDVSAADLLRDFDAVFLGAGLGADSRLGIPGEDGPGVIGATAWIERMKLEPGFQLGTVRRAIVVGGGNTSLDAARELAQLGVPEVTLVYRRTVAEMPGYAHELAAARREGVRVAERAVPQEFVRDDNGVLAALKLQDGRLIPCDLAIVGIGQSKLRALAEQLQGVQIDAKGVVQADPATGRTGNPRVFAGGDVLGGELVVTAVQDAKRAVRAICAALGVTLRPDAPVRAGHV
jgi:glutamate synthase (NADPH/NADH) small chain